MVQRSLIFIVLIFMASSVWAQDVDLPPGKEYIYKEVDGVKRVMEVYFPEGRKAKNAVPGILLFHGGGWGGGTRDQFKYQCNYFASRGLVAATVTYRLATREEKAAATQEESYKRIGIPDVGSAIRWFKQNAEELGVDPDRIILGGGSAGGHLSLLGSLNPALKDPSDPAGYGTDVAAYVLFNPAIVASDKTDKEVWICEFLRKDFPPSIAVFGSEDPWLNGWNLVAGSMKELGIENAELWIAEGQKHGFFNNKPWADAVLYQMDVFLEDHEFIKGKPKIKLPDSGEKLSRMF